MENGLEITITLTLTKGQRASGCRRARPNPKRLRNAEGARLSSLREQKGEMEELASDKMGYFLGAKLPACQCPPVVGGGLRDGSGSGAWTLGRETAGRGPRLSGGA